MVWQLLGRAGRNILFSCHRTGFSYHQKFSLVNVKLKWAKDKTLDVAVSGGRDLKAAGTLVSIIASAPRCCLPIYHISKHQGQLGLPKDLKLSVFIRRYPNIFDEFKVPDSAGTPVPWFQLTPEALDLHREELSVLQQTKKDLLDRLCKLLMLARDQILPLQTIDQLKWDLGLPYDYHNSLIPQHTNLFSIVKLPDDRFGLKLQVWDSSLAVSHLEKTANFQQREEDTRTGCLAFPIGFPRGFGLKRKCMEWLEEWQRLPYTSPYVDASHLDPRTDVSEKRNVGVFHELLHLTLEKKTERKNVSNLRTPLALPQKFTKVFERHPAIFYISMKEDTQTVVLREAYDRQQLIYKHPLVEVREKLTSMMRKGLLDKSRGVYKKSVHPNPVDMTKDAFGIEHDDNELFSGDSDCNLLFQYDSDDERNREESTGHTRFLG